MTSTTKKPVRTARNTKPARDKSKSAEKPARAKSGILKPKKGTKYTVSDGKMELMLEYDGAKWYVVTCPAIPDLLTQARTIDEAFRMAYDAKRTLEEFHASVSGRGKNE